MAVVSVPSVPVSDAALRLGVSEQRVRAMISAGSIEAEKVAGAWLIPVRSLARLTTSHRQGGRPFSDVSAWALLLLASGEAVDWASPRVGSRVAAAVNDHGLSGAFGKLRRRAARHVYEAHVAELPRIVGSTDLMLGGVSAAGAHKLGLQGGNDLEAYVAASSIKGVARRHGLVAGGEPNVVLRAVPDEIWSIVHRRVAPIAVVLADLAEHSDARARRVAYDRAGRLDRERARG
ncbi:MAG TPA: helix-turn-helix domain-containing protein [Solirubrobacteraceae bacterium]|nr:helix-turn-helix domain-containing protein [Solirubrobacteraceae bacterium]